LPEIPSKILHFEDFPAMLIPGVITITPFTDEVWVKRKGNHCVAILIFPLKVLKPPFIEDVPLKSP
jgi:hypothetical protein